MSFARIHFLCLVALAGLLAGGCATRDYNAAKAQTNKGYADFHADPQSDLYWDIYDYDQGKQQFRRIYSDLEAPSSGFLRLPLVPGRHRLQINFLNLALAGPAEVEVEIEPGKLTPVKVSVTPQIAATTSDESPAVRRNARGRYGYRTKIALSGAVLYQAKGEASAPILFEPKDAMPYSAR